ncbi:MAG: BamA/TamA family outer membrane protein, partial [Myxococcota bacterium]
RGYMLAAGLEGGKVIDDDLRSFLVLSAQAQAYVPLGSSRVTLGLRLRGASNVGERPLPLPLRVFGGGASGHRGFGRRELSPGLFVAEADVGPDGDDDDAGYFPVGGESLVLATAEVRFDLFQLFDRWGGLVVFTDVGDVALSPRGLDVSQPHVASGLGLRVGTPVGAIRFDLGYRLNRLGAGEPAPNDRWVPHLGIGEAF